VTVRANYLLGEKPTPAEWNAYIANPALDYITQISLNAVTSTISNVFSSTYDNYRLEVSGCYCNGGAATFPLVSFTGGAGTAHYDGVRFTDSTGAVTLNNQNGTGYWIGGYGGNGLQNASQITWDFFQPYVYTQTTYVGRYNYNQGSGFSGGYLNNTNSYTGFTITGLFGTNVSGVLTVFGYRKA
jgi:hypothetical protein